jgi:hypothetical protein
MTVSTYNMWYQRDCQCLKVSGYNESDTIGTALHGTTLSYSPKLQPLVIDIHPMGEGGAHRGTTGIAI